MLSLVAMLCALWLLTRHCLPSQLVLVWRTVAFRVISVTESLSVSIDKCVACEYSPKIVWQVADVISKNYMLEQC